MGKTVTFNDQDKVLIQRIEQYRKKKNLSSFVATVRELCDAALQLKRIAN